MGIFSQLNRRIRPRVAADWRRRREFLSQFVTSGTTVFDIGAWRGEYTETFFELGAARVVAVEPLAAAAREIASRAPRAQVEVAAVGAEPGAAVFFRSDRERDSTLSARYAEIAARDLHVRMTPIEVPVVTLDQLAERYGSPSFVKIDVEGAEPDVLAGMSFRPPSLSFEFHGSLLDEFRSSLEQLHTYRFRIVLGFNFRWSTPWIDSEAAVNFIAGAAAGDPLLFGDVYCVLA